MTNDHLSGLARSKADARGSKSVEVVDIIEALRSPSGDLRGDAQILIPEDLQALIQAVSGIAESESREPLLSDLARVMAGSSGPDDEVEPTSTHAIALHLDRVLAIGRQVDGVDGVENDTQQAIARLMCDELEQLREERSFADSVAHVRHRWADAVRFAQEIPPDFVHGETVWVLMRFSEIGSARGRPE